MDKYQNITSIVNGKFKRNSIEINKVIETYEGKEVMLTLEKPKKKRSNNQNAYYWSCLVVLMQQGAKDLWGEVWSIDKAHKFLSNKFVFHESVNTKTGEITNTIKSTTELTTTDWEVYMTEIRIYLLQDFDINAPEPNQEIKLEI